MPRQLRLSLTQARQPDFDDFVCGASNAAAAAEVRRWPDWRGGVLALIGPAGCGKTHLAQAWATEAGAVRLDPINPGPAQGEAAPLLLEDVDRGFDAEALFHLLNGAPHGRGLLLTARKPPTQWTTDLPDLRSRLNALPVAELEAPDDAVLEGVLRKFFRERNIRPPEAVYPYLLARIGRSTPDAREIVERLDEAGDEGFRPVTRALARQVLEAALPFED